MKAEEFKIQINGSLRSVRALPDTPLLWILRDHLHLTGVKYGCGIGQCGTCMVLVNRQAQRSCQLSLQQLAPGDEVLTLEAMTDPTMTLLRQCWIETNTPQCGYCQGGMLLQAWDLLQRVPQYDEASLLQAYERMLCRCGTYARIKAAIRLAYAKSNDKA